ncbi:MAG: MFS transporter [Cyanobacteria bacterium REEB67]|nr:MFS transporter [Cyanobacteria bacterium REEB67]
MSQELLEKLANQVEQANPPITSAKSAGALPPPRIPITSLAAVGITGFCAFINLYATQPLLPSLMKHFSASAGDVSMTVSATSLGVALAAPFTGIIADSIGRKRVIVPAMLLIALPTFIASFSSSLPELVMWRFIQGLILPAIFAISMAYVSEEWAEVGLGSAMTFYVTGNVLGGFAGRLISGLAAAHSGWQASFALLACIDIACAATALLLLPRSTRFKGAPRKQSFVSLLRAQFTSTPLIGSFLVGTNILFTLVAMFTYVTFHLSAAPFSLGIKELSWLFAVYLFGALVTPHTGKIIDRIGFHKTFIGAALISVLGNFITLIPTVPTVLLGLAITSAALFVCQSATTTSLRSYAVTGASAAAGVYVCFYYIGGSLGGFLPSLVWNHGGWPMCVALISGLQLATVILSLKLWDFDGEQQCRSAQLCTQQ